MHSAYRVSVHPLAGRAVLQVCVPFHSLTHSPSPLFFIFLADCPLLQLGILAYCNNCKNGINGATSTLPLRTSQVLQSVILGLSSFVAIWGLAL